MNLILTLILSWLSSSCMLREIPSTVHILDKKINCKYIRYALNLVSVVIDVHILLTPCITLKLLNLSDVR